MIEGQIFQLDDADALLCGSLKSQWDELNTLDQAAIITSSAGLLFVAYCVLRAFFVRIPKS